MIRTGPRRRFATLLAVALTAGVAPDLPVAAQTAPATRAQATADAVIQPVLNLHDADARVRQGARQQIMGMSISELRELSEALPQLPDAVRASPVTALTLHDAAIHIHLREAKQRVLARTIDRPGGDAFLGIHLGGPRYTDTAEDGQHGVGVRTTLPGFAAYEHLQDGDRLLAARTEEGLQHLPNNQRLREVMFSLSPGEVVEFLVLRGGRVESVRFRLDHRMEGMGLTNDWEEAQPAARREAEAFWEEQILPRLLPPPGATASA